MFLQEGDAIRVGALNVVRPKGNMPVQSMIGLVKDQVGELVLGIG